MDKEINYKPVQINKKFVSDFEQTYNNKKKEIIIEILNILREKNILNKTIQ
jgi:hypothetical protein|tara:strand:+ start:1416 stop:1568 length:153 start_codon:yes stop_codon:yes gene_type:complete